MLAPLNVLWPLDSDQAATDDPLESVVCLIWDKEMTGRTLNMCDRRQCLAASVCVLAGSIIGSRLRELG